MSLAIGCALWVGAMMPMNARAEDGETADRLRRMERDMTTLQQYVYKGKGGDAVASSGGGGGSASGAVAVKQMEMEEHIRQLNGRIETLEFSNKKLEKMVETLAASVTALETSQAQAASAPAAAPAAEHANNPAAAAAAEAITPTPKPTAAPEAKPTVATPPASPNSPAMRLVKPGDDKKQYGGSPEEMYNYGFSLLGKALYEEAEAVFKEFVTKYNKHDLTGNAYYWLGETYYARKQYDKSAVQFLKGYQDYPKSAKAADNLLKLGMSLGNLDQKKEACATLGRLNSQFPQASVAVKQRAKSEAERFACHAG
jgi:tol-pal system protein YbgF